MGATCAWRGYPPFYPTVSLRIFKNGTSFKPFSFILFNRFMAGTGTFYLSFSLNHLSNLLPCMFWILGLFCSLGKPGLPHISSHNSFSNVLSVFLCQKSVQLDVFNGVKNPSCPFRFKMFLIVLKSHAKYPCNYVEPAEFQVFFCFIGHP
ncbi:hypothetical protein OJAV_G00032090 [Oryzias javanicus]|uniref:Uncharacterized protein n=1 Tax=Oryzias javanicus TaxID=123683 RepID=A0A437DFH8_ORYJA|nr:hypothetical protein OJAV_G00032090 [Oryzias javanicus]